MPKVSDEHLRARRQEILDGATRCFARAGFHRTTVQDIAAESGLSPGLIYRYFADKDAMVVAIAARWHEREAEQLHSPGTLDGMAAGYLDLLRSLAEPAGKDRVRLGVQIWAEALREPRIHAVAREGVDGPRRALADLVRVAQDRGDVLPGPSPEGLARVFAAIYQGLALQTAWDPELDNAAYVHAVEALIGLLTR